VETTRLSLLLRIRNLQDSESWKEFIDIYTPFLYRVLGRLGLGDADAQDVIQETFAVVMSHIGDFEYDPSRSFRAWLATVARNKARRIRRFAAGGTANVGLVHAAPAPEPDLDQIIEAEWEKTVLELATREVEGRFGKVVMEAFRLAALERMPNEQVAEQLGIDVGYVYVCKSRVKKALTNAVKRIRAYEEFGEAP
jgi:RNA polymerase sigma-70 factor (ECF subfamily)